MLDFAGGFRLHGTILAPGSTMTISSRTVSLVTAFSLLVFAVATGTAAEKKEWVELTNCTYVVAQYNDGDSFRFKSGTNEFVVRLYFVDAPETNLRYPERTREQSEYFAVTLDEAMKAGAEARDAVRELLRDPFVVWTRWASAAGRGKETRYYGIVEINGKDLAEALVSKGLARAKGVTVNGPRGQKTKVRFEKLRRLEEDARIRRAGVWANSKFSEKDKQTQQ